MGYEDLNDAERLSQDPTFRQRSTAAGESRSLRIRDEGKVSEKSTGNSHDDASEAKKAPNH